MLLYYVLGIYCFVFVCLLLLMLLVCCYACLIDCLRFGVYLFVVLRAGL